MAKNKSKKANRPNPTEEKTEQSPRVEAEKRKVEELEEELDEVVEDEDFDEDNEEVVDDEEPDEDEYDNEDEEEDDEDEEEDDEEEDDDDDEEDEEDDDDDEEDDEEDDDEEDEDEDDNEDEVEKPKSRSVSSKPNKNPFKGFFKRKGDPNENILTIFKSPRIWGAVLGEMIGTMLLTMLMLTLGINQPLYIFIGLTAITIAVYAFSGACLNPLVTAGMMATRRVSAIRGVLYIIAEIVGAWLGLMIISAFHSAGEPTDALPTMVALENETIGHVIFIELVGAIIIGFFSTRAQAYRTARNAATYAIVVSGGVILAILFGIIVSGSFFSLQNNFMMNPAIAIMYQIFPSSAENFGELMSKIALSGVTYIIIPIIGGIIGSFISDIAGRLSGEEAPCDCGCSCKKRNS